MRNGTYQLSMQRWRRIVSYETLFTAEEATYGLIAFIVDEIAD